MEIGCSGKENESFACTRNTKLGPQQRSNDEVSQSDMPARRVAKAAIFGNKSRMGTHFWWRNMLAVILLTMMIENDIYESKRVVAADRALASRAEKRSTNKPHSNYNVDEHNNKDEIHDDDTHTDLDFIEGGNNDKHYNARNGLERKEDESREVLKIKRDFDTEAAESIGVEDSRYFSLDDSASNEVERYYDDSQDIIVIATVDGTFYGILRSTGQIIWKRRGVDLKKNNSSNAGSEGTDGNLDHRMQVNPSNGAHQPHQTVEELESITESKSGEVIFAPLTSTSTTKEPDTGGRASYRKGRTMAIPSVDGRVFLSSGRNDGNVDDPLQENGEQQPVNDFLSSSSSKIVRDLVIRSPFVDPQGRIYIGTSHSSTAAFDRDTGEILSFMKLEGGVSNNADETVTPFDEEQKNIIWVGRVDYSVSVFSSSGDADVKFSSSEVLSMDDMAKRQGQTIYNPALILPSPVIVATPGGKLAMVDSNSDKILWIADETFDTPVVYALESKYGKSLRVDFIPDAPRHRHFSKEYVSSMDEQGSYFNSNKMFGTESVVWAYKKTELFAVPIGRRRNYNGLLELPSSAHDSENDSKAISSVAGDQQCNPNSPLYAACISLNPSRIDNTSWFHMFLMSWFPPAIAFVFVISFEMGRRSRAEKGKAKTQFHDGESDTPSFLSGEGIVRRMSDRRQGAIKLSDEVLGYGGHGTIVYRGELDGRHVAVKRMLKAYHASAEREISLLIESDGHPHVVRYFLKEARGDFVYLALELCEMTLEDLIAALRQKAERISPEEAGQENSVLRIPNLKRPMKEVLFEVAQGVRHIHSLRIVHRDLKPQNILLAKKARGIDNSAKCTDGVYCAFQNGEYSPKISDMGLGKQLSGQSSFGLSTFNNSFRIGDSGLEEPLIRAGPGPGTVGWQAPEVMVQRPLLELSAASSNNNKGDGLISMIEASPIESSLSDRTSRSVDIFSLGCIFHYSLLPGFHPFGEWYERESNIMKNCPSLKALDDLPLDASDLIKQMINRKPSARPKASQVCNHPFFWTETKRLSFVCDLSDRVEHDAILKTDKEKCPHYTDLDALLIEQQAVNIVGTAWGTRLDQGFLNSVTKFRMYDQSSVRDLLRLIRNKHHHFDDLPLEVKEKIVSNQEDLMNYFESKFPCLLMHCYNVCCLCLTKDDPLVLKYDIQSTFQPKNCKILKGKDSDVSCAPEQQREFEKPKSSSSRDNCNKELSESPGLHCDAPRSPKWISEVPSNCNMEELTLTNPVEYRNVVRTEADCNIEAIEPSVKQYVGQSSVIAWEGSTTSSTLGCRGWMRSEDEWIERTDTRWGKVDATLIRGAQDQIFRTRLCNHWDMSQGAFCSLRKKNKCVFAHGPVELRVKDGKKGRWGKLVDLNGNNSNPFHSGGEDTYGAAKSIETVRKEEGKWKSPKKGKQRGKDSNSAGRKKNLKK